jgi:hypothetical protein
MIYTANVMTIPPIKPCLQPRQQISAATHRTSLCCFLGPPKQPFLPIPRDSFTCAITYRAGLDKDTCGEQACGPVKCWGHNDRGQSSPSPGVMFHELSSGGFFTCGLKVGGKIECWGEIDHPPKSLESLSSEELSDLKHARRLQQVAEGWRGATTRPVNGGGYYIQVSSGLKHACAISRYDSEVHCWGRNDYGESSPPGGKFLQVSLMISLASFWQFSVISLSHRSTPVRYRPVTRSRAA